MGIWKAMLGRISLFPASPTAFTTVSAVDLYKRLWGADPDEFRKNPNPLGVSLAQGVRSGLQFSCGVQQTRLDFTLTPSQRATTFPPVVEVSFVEDISDLRRALYYIVDQIGRELVTNVSRVALNLHFGQITPNIAMANKLILTVLPPGYDLALLADEDFVLQLNRPYRSRLEPHPMMNKIFRWSVDRIQVNMQVHQQGQGTLNVGAFPLNLQQDFIGARLTVDLNTRMENSSIFMATTQRELLKEALDELERVAPLSGPEVLFRW